ncbi:hypothetical protein [Paenibacillus ehimensis]|nr:hypothetical protein [Paenibacillus ehimensis]
MKPDTHEPGRREQMVLLLKKAGWYEGRREDISGFERRCKEAGIPV